MNDIIIKICDGVETTEAEAFSWYSSGKYIVKYQGVYQLYYSAASRHTYGRLIIPNKGMARRGRFYLMDAKTINHILKEKILREEG